MVDLNISIPDGFYEEEVCYEYTVTTEMKKVWAIELDLMNELRRVCGLYGLKWWAGAGTLLGAVRHHGFIPWDDDMDFYMLRPDYDILMQHSEDFRFPYFLQTSETEKHLLRTHAQLRRSDTTGYIKGDTYLDINKGIFIDIFPLDGISETEDRKQRLLDQRLRKRYAQFLDSQKHQPVLSFEKRCKKYIKKAVFSVVKKEIIYRAFENNLKKYSKPETKVWGNRTLVFDSPKSRRPVEDWNNIIQVPFEFTDIPIPENYDEILRQQYGDYMAIPKNKKDNIHGDLVLSTEHAYNDLGRNNL